jgi:Legionella pneumophila major outer membrane protein precursor
MRTAALAMSLPVASLWGLFGGCCDGALDYFQPAIDVYKNGDYYVAADFLYWTHSDCDYGYVATLNNILQTPPVPPDGLNAFSSRNNIEFVKPGYDPGVRVHVGFNLMGCLNQDLSYTWVEIRNKDAVRMDITGPIQQYEPSVIVNNSYAFTAGPADKITGEVFSRYQRLVWDIGVNFCMGDWGWFRAGGTPQWIGISHHRTTTAHIPALGQTYTDTQKSTFSGGGVGYFVAYMVHLNKCGLYSSGKVQVNTLLSRQRMTRRGVATIAAANFQPIPINEELTIPGRTCFAPGFEANFGVGYTKECKCFKVNVLLQYEIQHWLNALSYRVGGNQVVPSSKEDILFGGIAYGGPSIKLELGY